MMAMSVNGQVLLTPTNLRSAVEGGPAYTLSGAAGAFRITYTVESTAGVPIAIDDSTTLRLYVWGADGHLVFSNSPSSQPFAPLSEGKVKFTFANISSGEYRLQGVATPASGNTNENWNFTHHMLVVTNPPSAAAAQVSVSSTSVVDLGNVTVQWSIEGDGDLAPADVNRDVEPYSDLGADLGSTNKRWNSIHSSTVRVDKIIAAEADLGAVIGFVDATKVALLGETNAVILTNTSVQVRSPTNDNEVATMGYVNAVAGGDAIIGSMQIYTGLHGVAYFTNALGYPEPLREKSLPSTKWTTFIDFNGPEDIAGWSNLNVTGSAWTYTVTNGYLSIVGPNETASGRFFGLIPATTGVASRCAMRILQPLQYSYWANGNYGYGLSAYDVGLTNTVFHGRKGNSLGDVLETYIFNRSFSESQDTRYLAPYTAGSLSGAYTYLWGYSDLIMYGDFDGVSKLRFYMSNHGGERPALQYYATNCASVQAWAIFAQCSSAMAGGTNSSAFMIDWIGVLQSNLWTSAF